MQSKAPIQITLLRPQHPGNIGAAARAMKTMGQENLCLVAPFFFPSPIANALSSGGVDILDHARVESSLSTALAESTLIFGTAGRDSVLRFPELEAREACQKAYQAQQAGARVAFLFGTESVGLSNEELKYCHYHVRIPTTPDYSSLNLAQAVQIICYELWMACASSSPAPDLVQQASHAETERLYHRFEALLRQTNFLKPGHDKIILQKIRRLGQRAQLEVNEVKILQGILTAIQQTHLSQRS